MTRGVIFLFRLENVSKKYGEVLALNDINIHIKPGEFVFLIGPSGAGKSTLTKLILKEIRPTSGKIYLNNEDITDVSNRKIPYIRRYIGVVFQDFRLLPNKTVYENVAFAMEIFRCSTSQIRKRVPQVLEIVGIGNKANKYPDELSAGEQQRVAIARAIINNPKLLIADEPTGNLDPETAWDIMDILEGINESGTTIVMVTHSKNIVDQMEKRVVAIENGKIVRDDVGIYGYDESCETCKIGAFDENE